MNANAGPELAEAAKIDGGNLGTGSAATVLAGVVLSMIPALVVFVNGQRPLREGSTAGTSK